MKDSFGSAYMIYVFLAFVIVFIVFISLILKYAQAFKVKDQIINYIEEYENYSSSFDAISSIETYIEKETSYRPDSDNIVSNHKYGTCSKQYNFCINEHSKGDFKYYTVYTFVTWSFPFFNIGGVWSIKGESRVVASGVVNDYS